MEFWGGRLLASLAELGLAARRHRRRGVQPPARRSRGLDHRPRRRRADLRPGAPRDEPRGMGALGRPTRRRRARRAPTSRRSPSACELVDGEVDGRARHHDHAHCPGTPPATVRSSWSRERSARSCSATPSTARCRSAIPSGSSPPTRIPKAAQAGPRTACCASSTRPTRSWSARTFPTRCSVASSPGPRPARSRSTSRRPPRRSPSRRKRRRAGRPPAARRAVASAGLYLRPDAASPATPSRRSPKCDLRRAVASAISRVAAPPRVRQRWRRGTVALRRGR